MLSIVVPVYNVSAYLADCINSILQQTYTDLEILLVDDGSTDDSGKICDEYAKKDSRIKVIHKPNGGLMSAWKAGASVANGKYVGFVDSDDEIDNDMYERLYEVAAEQDADIVVCGLVRDYGAYAEKETLYLSAGVYDRKAIETQIYPIQLSNGTMLNRGLSPNRVTKLFKRSILLNNLTFCDERVSLGEDLVTTFACMSDAQTVVILDDFFPYRYKIRDNSIMGSSNLRFYSQTELLSEVLHTIADDKQVYDFSQQLTDDFVSLAYYGIERNIAGGQMSASQAVEYIKSTVCSAKFLEAFKAETLSLHNKKCLLYKWMIKISAYYPLYWFVKYVVVAVRAARANAR